MSQNRPTICHIFALAQLVNDIATGTDYLSAVLDGDIKDNDIVLRVSLNGAAL